VPEAGYKERQGREEEEFTTNHHEQEPAVLTQT